MKKLSIVATWVLFFVVFCMQAQDGGMWIPSLLNATNEQEMKSLGGKLSKEDIYSINNSSLKDAIVQFNGGCTAEIISPNGLLLTNHHCGYYHIQSHSSIANDYLKNGFWAKSQQEELPNKNLEVTLIVKIEEVTSRVLKGINKNTSIAESERIIKKNTNKLKKKYKREAWQNIKVKSFFKGNQYFLFVTESFKDIRLVGAPPSSIGKFGADTDNWAFPRHTGDFSMFRIYADKNNRPAEYSKDNVPYTPKHFLPISLDGVTEGDFTLIFGFPGRTNEYLPAVAMQQVVSKVNPINIEIRQATLGVMDLAMRSDDKIRIQYASKQARIANYWKKWIGENQGIERSDAINKKRYIESVFMGKAREKGYTEYYKVLDDFHRLYMEFEPYRVKRSAFLEIFNRNSELMRMLFYLYPLELVADKGDKKFNKVLSQAKGQLRGIHKNFNVGVDKAIFEAIMPIYDKAYGSASFYDTTKLTSLNDALSLLEGSKEEILKKLNQDPAYQFAKKYMQEFYYTLEPNYHRINGQIAKAQKLYMEGLIKVFPDKVYYPDANSTLRVAYGQVKGYSPRDAVKYEPITYLEGVMEKFKPGDYEFDVPKKLRDLYGAKDYGIYGDTNGKLPVCFIGNNHTTGGNSGSPALDAHGNLIGLNFDRVWEGTMSDMNYDPEICRNIMVDVRYILFIVDKFAGAEYLLKEMKFVHPKYGS